MLMISYTLQKIFLTGLLVCLYILKGFAVSDTLRVDSNYLQHDNSASAWYKWQYIRGDDKRYATPEWTAYTALLDRPLILPDDSLYATLEEAGWFRVWIRMAPEMLGTSLGFTFDGYGLIDIYFDSKPKASVPAHKDSLREPVRLDYYPVFFSLTDTAAHLIAIRYENPNTLHQRQWGFRAILMEAGDLFHTDLNALRMVSLLVLPVGSTFVTLFVVHIFLFFFYRKDISNLYFALFNLGCSIFFFTIYVDAATDVDLDQSFLSMVLLVLSGVLSCYFIAAFCTHLFSRRKIFLRIIGAVSVLMVTVTVVFYVSGRFETFLEWGLTLLAILTSIYVVAVFIHAMINKVRGSRILGAGILFTIFFVFSIVITFIFNDGNLSTSNLFWGLVLVIVAALALFSVPLSISSFLAWRYASTSKNLQLQLDNVAALSEKNLQQEREKQQILENQKTGLEKEVALRTREIVQEKQKSDNLLLNILPQEVADELKARGDSKARHYDEVSVLFTDLVNFTSVSEKLDVEELMHELNVNFTAFDNIMEKYGLEKIKTIGDAYLAVSGLPIADPAHAQHAVKAALEILAFVEQRKKQVPYGMDIRIGIHSGPLVAGIIGVKKFAYDIWGDTVNTAARMEQNSLPGKINISEQTCRLVQNDFACTYRGKIAVKGKGDLDMYFVEKQ